MKKGSLSEKELSMPEADANLNSLIRAGLMAEADAAYADFSAGLLPGTKNILGVRLPVLRRMAKQIAKGNWQDYLPSASDSSFEEIMLQGLVIGYADSPPDIICSALSSFVSKIDNWSVCDSTASGLKIARRYPLEFRVFVEQCLFSGKEFQARFGIVIMLNHYLTPAFIDQVLASLVTVPAPGYYCKMAMAWAVSCCYLKFPEKTETYLGSCHLDDWTFNKSIQKIRELSGISAADKERMIAWKRPVSRAFVRHRF